MIDFLPERIYNAIKEDQEYENILMYRENEFRKLLTFKEFCLYDNVFIKNKIKWEYFTGTLQSLVKKYCPEYMTELDIAISPRKTRADYLNIYYNDTKIDFETKLFVLSKIADMSKYKDDYFNYLGMYCNLYENIAKSDAEKYSAIIHYTYIQYATLVYAKTLPKDSQCIFKIKKYLDTLRFGYGNLSADALNVIYINTFVQCITLVLEELENDMLVKEMLDDVQLPESLFEVQYGNYGITRLALWYKLFEINFSVRDFAKCKELFNKMVDLIDGNLKEPQLLFRGLYVYNQNNIPYFYGILRFICRMLGAYDPTITLHNLSEEDKQFISIYDWDSSDLLISDRLTSEIFYNYALRTNLWFYNSAEALKAYKYYVYEQAGLELPSEDRILKPLDDFLSSFLDDEPAEEVVPNPKGDK